MALPTSHSSDHPHEECGVFGIFAPGEDVSRIAFFGLYALQHRGQESAGIAVSDGHNLNCHKNTGLVSLVFDEEILQNLQGIVAVGHTRYSTTGSNTQRNAQPVICDTSLGPIAVAHNGNLINTRMLRQELTSKGVTFEGTNDSEIIAKIIAIEYEACKNPVKALRAAMKRICGAYSLVVMGKDFLMACRDPYGLRPLCLGNINGHYLFSSETCAINVVAAKFIRELAPGEIVLLDDNGITACEGVPMIQHALCAFETIYFARPDSQIYGRTLHGVRRNFGKQLAIEHAVEADIVIPIPDTGIPGALGYSNQSGIPYCEGLIKNRYIHRTFIQPDQRMRELGVKVKLNPLPEVIKNKRVIMVDDSIVRGTTTRKLVKMLFDEGAAEVHVRITSPPVQHPCFYGIDMATPEELIAANFSVEQIRERIGATSLGYLSVDGLMEALRMTSDNYCLACFNGEYPIEVTDELRTNKLQFEDAAVCGAPEAPVP